MMVRMDTTSPPISQDEVLGYLTEHLQPRTPLPQPVLFRAHSQRGCIPTPTVGHVHRMKELREAVNREWGGRLQVIGAGVGGVSVGDCIEQGRRVGKTWNQE